LRVLQTGEYERLGSSVTRKADVRIISATNLNLRKAIADGSFREDLYFRLNVIDLPVPALADRADDILPLAEYFLAQIAGKEGKGPATFSPDARAALLGYDWPGNVRELQNRVQRAVLVAQGPTVDAAALALPTGHASKAAASSEPALTDADDPSSTQPTAIRADDPERLAIEEALVRAGGVVSRAAVELGLSRQALYRRMERFGLSLERRVR
jgi:DNA-binding NtrC family response regulator